MLVSEGEKEQAAETIAFCNCRLYTVSRRLAQALHG